MVNHASGAQPQPARSTRAAKRRRSSARGDRLLGDRRSEQGLRRGLQWLTAIPPLSVMALCSAGWAAHTHGAPGVWAVAGAGLGCGLVVLLSAYLAGSVAAQVHSDRVEQAAVVQQWMKRWQTLVTDGRRSMTWMREQIDQGECPPPVGLWSLGDPHGEPLGDFERELRAAQLEALDAVSHAAARQQQAAQVQQVEVFVVIARRLHALVTRTLATLDGLEKEVEDPDLLHGLFRVDHLTTQTRRQVESLAVLGHAVPRRILTPVLVSTVLRQAVAEIEHYTRVRVYPPRTEVAVPGHAAPDVIHLLAELVENATKFSPSHHRVALRAERVNAGLAIEVDDRGLCMPGEQLEQLNQRLAMPDAVDVPGQLRDGRIGLLVAARIAQRHGITVQLRANLFEGTQALIILPRDLVAAPADAPTPPSAMQGPAPQPRPTTAQLHPALVPNSAAPIEPPQPVAAVAPPTSPSDSRPALPRRDAAHTAIARHPESEPAAAEPPPARADLMARYTAGVHRVSRSSAKPADDRAG